MAAGLYRSEAGTSLLGDEMGDKRSAEAIDGRGRESKTEAVQRTGVASGVAAECGLCLDEFLDCGKKVPRNLLCGHTFCTG